MQLEKYVGCREYEKVVSTASGSKNGLTFEIKNQSGVEIAKWDVDCLIKGNDTRKCDYLFVVKGISTCYWVELKDEGFDEACEQIHTTITKITYSDNFKIHHARIVLGRFKEDRNRIDSIRYVNQKKLVNRIGRLNLVYKTKILTDTI